MKNRTENILIVLTVLAWVAFVGLCVELGVMLVGLGIGLVNPAAASDWYRNLKLSELMQANIGSYLSLVSLMVAGEVLKAYVAYLVIQVLSKIKFSNPFTLEISGKLEQISHLILGIWVVALLHKAYIKWLTKQFADLPMPQVSEEMLLVAGVVYVFAQVFKKGVELQSENELTV